ncbi:MAG: ABC transporter substrate-binding protein [Alphaproteobacteria bacterium]|nr:ABC transporter substrate-binding protein [Alphaproteobacteria bacterium]
MKKIALSLILVLSLAACGDKTETPKENTKPVVKIGVMLPLSGDNAIIGKALKGAVEVAINDIKKDNTKYNYDVIFEDSQLRPTTAISIANKLANIDKVDAILTYGSNIAHSISQITESNKIIQISLASSPTAAIGKYNFINWTKPETEAIRLGEEIKKLSYKKIAIVITNHEGAYAAAKELQEQLATIGVKSSVHTVNAGSKDMRIEIQKMMQDDIDLYVLSLYNPENQIFVRQLREAGSMADISAIESFNFYNDFTLLEGMWYVDGASSENSDVINRIKKHNNLSNSYGIGQFYDNIMMLKSAFENSEQKNDAINYMLNLGSYIGVVGQIIQNNDGIFDSKAVIKKIIKGKPVVVEE